MARVIAFANQKGGSGKTTCAINVASGIARRSGPGKVLLIDLDSQSNATSCMLGAAFALGPVGQENPVVYEVLLEKANASEALYPVELKEAGSYPHSTLDMMPSHGRMATVSAHLLGQAGAEFRLADALEPLLDRYEIIIIDCPPSLDIVTINALTAATEIIIPVNPGVFPLEGLAFLTDTIRRVQRRNPRLYISGVVASRHDQTVLARDTRTMLKGKFSDRLLPDIPARVAIGEAHAARQDIYTYAPNHKAAAAFWELSKEVLRRG